MELILLILKIILIAFLAVLGVILLALGIILFVPIRYEISGSIGDAGDYGIKGKVSYLLSAVKVLFSYEREQFDIKLFLFGLEKKMQSDDETVSETNSTEDDVEVTVREKCIEQDIPEPTSHDTTQEPKSEKVTQEPEKPKKPQKAKAKKEKKQSKIDFAFIKQQLTDEHNKSVVRKIWSELTYLLKHFKFRKIVTDLVFATGDPATTGQALGILCMIPMLYRYEFKIVPDFEAEEAYIKGTFLVAGKIRLIHVLVTALRLIFDKEVRLVVKRIMDLL